MRKKLVIIAMAALALLTAQCKKNEPKPSEKVMVPITGTVDFGGSKTEITTTGCINPVVGDKIYIYSENQDAGYHNVGYVNCTAISGQQFSCSGEIEEGCLGKTCTFMYLGTGSTDAGGDPIDGNSTTISFANQTSVSVSNDGKIANLNKFHVGSCKATVSEQGTVTLPMLSKMAIAYFQLKDEQDSPIANKDVTISGPSATATINTEDGTLMGSTGGDITVRTGADGSFYMALIPQNGPVVFTFSCACYENGTSTFSNGIRECNFYSEQGVGNPLQVEMAIKGALLPGVFTVGVDAEGKPIKVRFSKGNLWADAGNALHFEDAQWKSIPTSDGAMDNNHVSHFTWSSTVADAVGRYDSGGYLFCDESHKVSVDGSDAIYYALSGEEWQYLFDKHSTQFAMVNGVFGIVIAPDGFAGDLPVSYANDEALAANNLVFLPAVGYRNNTNVSYSSGNVSIVGQYWSSSQSNSYSAYRLKFSSSELTPNTDFSRFYGLSVRLVSGN